MKCTFTLRPKDSTSGCLPKRSENISTQRLYIRTFIAALPITTLLGTIWCLSWLNKLWHIHAKEYYSSCKKRNRLLVHTITRMNLQNSRLREWIRLTWKLHLYEIYMSPFIWNCGAGNRVEADQELQGPECRRGAHWIESWTRELSRVMEMSCVLIVVEVNTFVKTHLNETHKIG